MNNTLETLKEIYKPYKITYQNSVIILNTTSGDIVIKKKSDKDIKELYSYLISRNFTNFPKIEDNNRSDYIVYEYLSSVNMPIEQKAYDLVNVLSNLHNSTTYYKTITKDDFKIIFDKIKENIIYLTNYYEEFYETIKKEVYMTPSHYLIMRNISKIFSCLTFCQSELDNWYNLVKEDTKKRVCLIHNNLSLDHFLKNEKDYLISWENSRIDTPIIDLVGFYKKEYFNIHFSSFLEKYLEKVNLNEDELKLFFILISIPPKLELNDTEFKNCEIARINLDYLTLTEELVRPYYTIQKEN